jgi:hypothetical protein
MARRPAALADLRAVATECQALAADFSDEEATEGLTTTDELRALFQRPAAASSAVAGSAAQLLELLSVVPLELMSIILSQLDIRDLACLAATCRSLWCGAPTPPPLPLTPGLVETELRRRAEARGLQIGLFVPAGALSWVPYLLKRDFHDALRRQASLAVGETNPGARAHSHFVDRLGCLNLACSHDEIKAGLVGEPLLGHECGLAASYSVSVPPTPVPSMQHTRIVSVTTGNRHCLALSDEGEIYSWGDGTHGALGHADGSASAGPKRIETLARAESIAAGRITSAVVDDRGRLFTWGRAKRVYETGPTGLGFELGPATECQLTPKRVDVLSDDRVVGVALGLSCTLAVTDAGAVFSFGYGGHGGLGHGSLKSVVLPRRIEALVETGRRFVAVAAENHALALTEEGQVYGWGSWPANGHGQEQHTPQRVVALLDEQVKLVYARGNSSCAVTEKGELYTWGRDYPNSFHFGHGVAASQPTPKRVEALRRVKVVAAAICNSRTLVAGEDGVVWAFGERTALGFGDADALPGGSVLQPTLIPNLRVRTLP